MLSGCFVHGGIEANHAPKPALQPVSTLCGHGRAHMHSPCTRPTPLSHTGGKKHVDSGYIPHAISRPQTSQKVWAVATDLLKFRGHTHPKRVPSATFPPSHITLPISSQTLFSAAPPPPFFLCLCTHLNNLPAAFCINDRLCTTCPPASSACHRPQLPEHAYPSCTVAPYPLPYKTIVIRVLVCWHIEPNPPQKKT